MSSKPTQTHTPSFTIISRMQCWLYSIRVQIIMSHFFHIKKKSIIISIVLVKFVIACVAGAKRGGGGGREKGNPPPLFPFLPILYPLPLSTPATQAKFVTIVRWMYKIPSERGHKRTSTTHQRVREAIHCGNCSLVSSDQKIGWICTQKASEINDCNLLWHLSFLYDE